ncbi:MAG: tRNA (adenosine(37)-N6)-threonylcarbamoyltransferase complex ATPase subunit type 1 TsaE, partial [Candidatus Latescibacteria bacterium]|nr:tRNA (adenosine(37)-N6)-threonylcarbamoyltransferase complex ATPase subunit type 1 TsaE [Candidatus Latescibacterota bacterium]
LGIDASITSPTFTLVHEYPLPDNDDEKNGAEERAACLYHMDLYRINDIMELRETGIEDYLYGDGICLVEWGEKLGVLCPDDAAKVTIGHLAPHRREICIERMVGNT